MPQASAGESVRRSGSKSAIAPRPLPVHPATPRIDPSWGNMGVMVNQTPDVNAVKIARPDHAIHDLLSIRWSPRAFADRPVEPEKLRSMLEAARWSASSGNGQPWSFLIATREEPDAFARLVGCLSEGNTTWAPRAPVLGMIVARLVRAGGKPNRHAFYDVGLAMQNFVVQATAVGVYVRQMGGFSPETARESFGIPEEHEAVTAFAAGYLGELSTLSEAHREQEIAARTRHPLRDFVFGDRWGETSAVLG